MGTAEEPSTIKRVLHRLGSLAGAHRSAGLVVALRWYWERVRQNLGIAADKPWCVKPRQVRFPLTVHRRQTTDLRVFEQIFVKDAYRCLCGLGNVRAVMDLGANVGFSAVYFLSIFPDALVVAVEPFRRNYDVLLSNVAPYGKRALPVFGAVWPERSLVAVAAGAAEWAKRVVTITGPEDTPVEAYDMPSLMKMARIETIDLLKVDIEGTEALLFNDSAHTWLDDVRNICIELHGPDCRSRFFRAVEAFDYELLQVDELTLCLNLRRKSSASVPAANTAAAR